MVGFPDSHDSSLFQCLHGNSCILNIPGTQFSQLVSVIERYTDSLTSLKIKLKRIGTILKQQSTVSTECIWV